MTEKLLGCPFCSSSPVYASDGGRDATISCQKCRQALVKASWYNGDLGLTEAAWNTRAPASQWRPIESAPKEFGKPLLLLIDNQTIEGEWCGDEGVPGAVDLKKCADAMREFLPNSPCSGINDPTGSL